MGQVWSKADFDGTDGGGHEGGRGSVLAVTAQNSGEDGQWDTTDDMLAPLNRRPVAVSEDNSFGPNCNGPSDRVRGFTSMHRGGAFFLLGDGSVRFIPDNIDQKTYRALSTIRDGETVGEF